MTTDTLPTLQSSLNNRRNVVVLGLAGLIGVHIMDLPGKWEETFYLAIAYLGLIAVALVLIERLTTRPSRLDYLASAGLSAAVLLAYTVNRTVGMPGAMDDLGNWFEPLGLLSLGVELFLLWHSLAAYRTLRAVERLSAGRPADALTAA